MQNVALLVNPLLTGRSQRKAVLGVESVFREGGLHVATTPLGTPDTAADIVRAAIAGGCEAVVVCGGDGTIHAVLQGLAGRDVPLGVIPMGTGNILAQNLGLPRNPVAAARAVLRSRPRAVQLGKVSTIKPGDASETSSLFASAAGLGGHAMLMSVAEKWGKHRHGRAAYYFAGIDLLLRRRIESFEVEITTTSGQTITQQASELLTVRVPKLNRWRPGGDLRQPWLRVAVTSAASRWQLARASIAALASARPPQISASPATSLSNPHAVRYYDAVRVVCRPLPGRDYHAPVLLQADGELLGESNAVLSMAGESLLLLWPEL